MSEDDGGDFCIAENKDSNEGKGCSVTEAISGKASSAA